MVKFIVKSPVLYGSGLLSFQYLYHKCHLFFPSERYT